MHQLLGTQSPNPPSVDHAQAPSWASLLQPKIATGFKVNYIKPNRGVDWISIKLPKEMAIEGSKAWTNTLIGYFTGKKLPYTFVKNASSRLWSKAGLHDMLATEFGYFFFRFNSNEECNAVLEGGP